MTNDSTIVEIARLLDDQRMLCQLEIVLAGAGERGALGRIYEEIGVPHEDADTPRCVDPYHAAALRGDADMIRWLHARGAVPLLAQVKSVPLRGDGVPNYCEALHMILATIRDDECAKAMLECRFVDPKWPVAHEAAVYRNTSPEGPEYLLADVRNPQVDQQGWKKAVREPRPLDFAICNDLPKTTEYLLGLGLEPTSRTFTVLLAAKAQDRAVAFLQTHRGYADSLLIAAVFQKDASVMRQALSLGGNPNVWVRVTQEGGRPYRQPVLMSCVSIEQIRLLVEAGADVDARDEHGESMFIRMVKDAKFGEGHVRDLVAMGADPAQTAKGRSLMQMAAKRDESFKRMLRALKSGKEISGAFGGEEEPQAAVKPSAMPGPL